MVWTLPMYLNTTTGTVTSDLCTEAAACTYTTCEVLTFIDIPPSLPLLDVYCLLVCCEVGVTHCRWSGAW